MKDKIILRSIIVIALALIAVIAVTNTFTGAETPVAENENTAAARYIEPYFLRPGDNKQSPDILFYPEVPRPGDFLIVEAGPFAAGSSPQLKLGFDGTAFTSYEAGGLLYTLVAISCDSEPGLYNVHYEPGGPAADLVIAEREFPLSRFSMPADRTTGWTTERLAEDREKVRLARDSSAPFPLWTDRFILPVEGRITSEFGALRIINNNPPRRHSGIDIGAPEGTPVLAANSGNVQLAEYLLSGGNTVIIDHGIGLTSTYMHLESIAVEQGAIVDGGTMIGTLGMTGYATGPHLHWEVNIGQEAVNPEQLLANDLLWVPPAYVASFIDTE